MSESDDTSIEIRKRIYVDAVKWSIVGSLVKLTKVGQAFEADNAYNVNQFLGAKVLREQTEKDDGFDLPLDTLVAIHEGPGTQAPDVGTIPDGGAIVEVSTRVPMYAELLGIPVPSGAPGVGCTFGPHCVFSDMLNLQVAYVEESGKSGKKLDFQTPSADYQITEGDIIWCQMKHRRFKNLMLVVSPEVFNSGLLKGVICDRSLAGNKQYIMLPEIVGDRDEASAIPVDGNCKWSVLLERSGMDDKIKYNMSRFFFGDAEVNEAFVQLKKHQMARYQCCDEDEGFETSMALGGKNVVEDLRRGKEPCENDCHGYEKTDVDMSFEMSIYGEVPANLIGAMHKVKPPVAHGMPPRADYDGDIWWEGPTRSGSTVLQGRDEMLFLRHSPFWRKHIQDRMGIISGSSDIKEWIDVPPPGLSNPKQPPQPPSKEIIEERSEEASTVRSQESPWPSWNGEGWNPQFAHMNQCPPWGAYPGYWPSPYGWDASHHLQWLVGSVDHKLFEKAKDSRNRELQVWRIPQKHIIEARPFLASKVTIEGVSLDHMAEAILSTNDKDFAVIIQKWLVASSEKQITDMVECLEPSATDLLYNEPGCFIVSQILQEGFARPQFAPAASNFLAKAHDFGNTSYRERVLGGMKNKCANHAMKMWVQLLHELHRRGQDVDRHLETILGVMQEHVMTLVCDVHGVRAVNGVLELAMPHYTRRGFYEHRQVMDIVKGLSDGAKKEDINYLIRHQFGNHTIQQVLEFSPRPILDVICDNFVQYATHGRANYVIQRAIEKTADIVYVEKLFRLFLENKDDIMKQGSCGAEIMRTLDETLRNKFGKMDLASQLQDGSVSWKRVSRR